MNDHLRHVEPDQEQRTTPLELFFDLVFVFAITQISSFLFHHLDLEGAVRSVLLLFAVWWGWIYTTWMTNWFDPDHPTVRAVLIVLMLAVLCMAIALPEAFGARGLMFAVSYVLLQGIRNVFVSVSMWRAGGTQVRSFVPLTAWGFFAGIFWIAGGLSEDSTRAILWVIALAVELTAPAVRYWLPGSGSVPMSAFAIDGAHFAERCQLFVIIALGESIVVTGATAAPQKMSASLLAAITVAFLTAAALWWLYFDYVAEVSTKFLANAEESAKLARDAYTYVHIVIVAGIIVTAVGAEELLANPGERLDTALVVAICAGPVLYLLGHIGFRRTMVGSWSWRRIATAAAIVLVGLVAHSLPALAIGTLVLVCLITLAATELTTPQRLHEQGLL